MKFIEIIKVVCLLAIAASSVLIAYQTFNIKNVYVVGGSIDANVDGVVEVSGGHIDIDNEIDVNIESVLGGSVGAHRSYTDHGREYWAIDVFGN